VILFVKINFDEKGDNILVVSRAGPPGAAGRRSTSSGAATSGSGGSGEPGGAAGQGTSTVIPRQDSLIGDLLGLDLGPTVPTQPSIMSDPIAAAPVAPSLDILGGGLDSLVSDPLSFVLFFIFSSFILFYFLLSPPSTWLIFD
jgi:hypothetical protein